MLMGWSLVSWWTYLEWPFACPFYFQHHWNIWTCPNNWELWNISDGKYLKGEGSNSWTGMLCHTLGYIHMCFQETYSIFIMLQHPRGRNEKLTRVLRSAFFHNWAKEFSWFIFVLYGFYLINFTMPIVNLDACHEDLAFG